eukprot:comp39875_c0_seq1/m.47400 comp39875_c0_seq1/g.47400  ORF comp39875_c0_seq1/g.47400 comp39875_c0_seq1/m.47400 type:complete len:337 (-) comp39875_c0_seq1:386-1396(-)
MVLPESAYTIIHGQRMCRVLVGMWQLSGHHGFKPAPEPALESMKRYVDAGFTTFDLSDHYGPSEDYVGMFSSANPALIKSSQCLFFTKWVPRPGPMTREVVDRAIGVSLARMQTQKLDMLQFHWWDYGDRRYLDALKHMQKMVKDGRIGILSLTNFDTERLKLIVESGIEIASNQVQFSLVDQRPLVAMAPFCRAHNIQLLTYGTLCGGFFSENWLGKPEPTKAQLDTASKGKYYNMIRAWGGWPLFQELLQVVHSVAQKHNVEIANVAIRWVLDQPAVGGVIVGARLGHSEHIEDTAKTFSFSLDEDDRAKIRKVTEKSRNLFEVMGDCGDEYRG